MSRDGLLGVVLAGGASTRFGSDKAAARVGGRSMLRRSLDALAPWVEEAGVVLSASPARDPADLPPVPVRRDREAGRGPLEGLRVALAWARELERVGVVVLACDLPLLVRDDVGELVAAWRLRPAGAPDGVVPVVDGRPQPLAAVYDVSVLDVVDRRLEGPDRSLRGMLQDLRVQWIPTGPALPPERFLNVNTPEDRARAGALDDGGGRDEGGSSRAEGSGS